MINLQLYDSHDEYRQNIVDAISFFPEKHIHANKTVTTSLIPTDYFRDNDKWHISFFTGIERFKETAENYLQDRRTSRNLSFDLNNANMNNELKYIVHSKIFREEWSLPPTYGLQTRHMKRYALFINERYPSVNSLLELDAEQVHTEWVEWLRSLSVPIKRLHYYYAKDRYFQSYTQIARFLKNIYKYLFALTDTRDEWDKDIWDVRNLQQYGIGYDRSKTPGCLDFTKIINPYFRRHYKKFTKEKLLGKNSYTWGTSVYSLAYISRFLNCIAEIEPSWKDLKSLERCHIEKYIEALNKYAAENLRRYDSNPRGHINCSLATINRFLSELQIRDYGLAPEKNILSLIFSHDKPTVPKKPYDQIDYIPDFVLEQLFDRIDLFNKEAVPVLWTMYKTGLRISDTLGLKHGCLLKINGEYWIECDISKTYVQGHRIPIDDELASLLAVLINESVRLSNTENNPDKYIFVRYKGKSRGNPYSQNWFRDQLNRFTRKYHITDEQGGLYHFKNHAFRHTYAIKMMNSGVDIVTIQELLAHASPEMTLRYAKLLDNTKRKAFDKAVSQGVFSFQGDMLRAESDGEFSVQMLDMLWTNHKLHAVDTPYGACLQRKNGNCQYAKRPPCLSCNAGFPCKDLCIGALDGDIQKYELLIQSAQNLICNAENHGRSDIAASNEELLVLYQDIYTKISQGNIIYSRIDRLKDTQIEVKG